MTRVAYVCADPGVPVFGSKGSSVHAQSVVQALLRRGASVHLLAARTGGPVPAGLEAAVLHRLPRPPKGDAAERERLALAANESLATTLRGLERLDLVYERCSLWSFAALAHARAAGVPSVLEVNAPLVEEQARHRDLVDRAAAERVADRQARDAGVLVAVSENVARRLRERHPAAAGHVHVIPNGVDPARFRDRPADPASRPYTVGFVGTLKPWHGLQVLVDAFARLRDAVPEARLLVVGDGPGRAALEAGLAARDAVAAARLTGAVPPPAVPALLARMDVAVAPYPPQEGFYFSPLKVVEAMAAGLPVVASDIGQLGDLIESGRTGVLVPPGDARALAAALADLAARPARRAAIGAAARRAALARDSWDEIVARVLDLAGVRERAEAA
jgi:glycosyltransferase involved in cell wall biosynthesis